MDALTVKLEAFEGPLDLLLYLIKKMEIDIADIPITEIVEQYMDYLNLMKELELDSAGEYLVMAATLLSIKSAMLLPQKADISVEVTDEDDPRAELVDMLKEYRTYQEAAKELSTKEWDRQQYYTKPADDLDKYLGMVPLIPGQVKLFDLLAAFQELASKKAVVDTAERTVAREEISMEEKLIWMKNKVFASTEPILFSQLITGNSRNEVIAAFLALLELIKEEYVVAYQESIYHELTLSVGTLLIEEGVQ